jgi:epoxyqueuosine reductase QueG
MRVLGPRRKSPQLSGISYPVSRHSSREVCPFSRKFSEPSSEPAFASRGPGEPPVGVERVPSDGWHPGTATPSLIDLMSMDESGWEAFSRGSPLRRTGRAGFRRNVAVGLGNWGDEASTCGGSRRRCWTG